MKPETMSSKTGPYTVEKSGCVYIIMGPDGRWPFHFTNEGIAKIRANDLNIAYMAGQESSRWIPVSERLPYNKETVLALFRHGDQDVCFFYDGHWSGHSASMVTHWQPLPKAPNT